MPHFMFRSRNRKLVLGDAALLQFAHGDESHHDLRSADHRNGGLRIEWYPRDQRGDNANIATPRACGRGLQLRALRTSGPRLQLASVEQILRCARAAE